MVAIARDVLRERIESFINEEAPENLSRYRPEFDTHIEYTKNGETKNYRVWDKEKNLEEKQSYLPAGEFRRIGTTLFDVENKQAVGFTIDIDFGHSSNPQTEESIRELKQKVAPFADVLSSTGGKGLHIVGWFDTPIPCESRREYSAICKAAARVIENLADCSLVDAIDKDGGILWLASIDQAENAFEHESPMPGLATISAADVLAELDAPPPRREPTTKSSADLQPEHERVLAAIKETKYPCDEHTLDGSNAYRTHLCALAEVHANDDIRGPFKTTSPGNTPHETNCTIIPLEDGGWKVLSFRKEDGEGWFQSGDMSVTYFDCPPYAEDVFTLAEKYGGNQLKGLGKDVRKFADTASLAKVLEHFGIADAIPEQLGGRQATLKVNENSLEVTVPRLPNESPPDGWVASKQQLVVTFPVEGMRQRRSIDIPIVRVAYPFNEFGKQTGDTQFHITHDDETVKTEPLANVKLVLKAKGYKDEQITDTLGKKIANPLKISTQPFKSGEVGGFWFRGYQLACEPKPGSHPHYDMVFNHIGRYLDPYVKENDWCQINGIKSGYDFLIVYAAIMFQHPEWRVPQVFLYSEGQETGKNTWPDSLGLLMEPGAVVDAVKAAISGSAFSGELEGKLIYTLHELDLSEAGSKAESRVREWVTNPRLEVHPKGVTPYTTVNYGRVIQTANFLSYKIVDSEDSRVIVIEVPPIQRKLHWHLELEPALKSEAAAFLHTLLSYKLPEKGAKGSRLYLPVFDTAAKKQAVEASLMPLTEDHERLFSLVIERLEAGEWVGLFEYHEIQKLIDAPSHFQTWRKFWSRAVPHFKAAGYTPIYREAIRRQVKAAYGFKQS